MKSSGMACVISKKWAAYFWNKMIFFLYLMAVKFLFKNLELWVWIIYAAPSEPSMLQDSLSIIEEVGKEHSSQPRLHIVMGDWNLSIDGFLDREPPNSSHNLNKCSKLIDSNIHDVYRRLNPQE